jgi:hypothetical protein
MPDFALEMLIKLYLAQDLPLMKLAYTRSLSQLNFEFRNATGIERRDSEIWLQLWDMVETGSIPGREAE